MYFRYNGYLNISLQLCQLNQLTLIIGNIATTIQIEPAKPTNLILFLITRLSQMILETNFTSPPGVTDSSGAAVLIEFGEGLSRTSSFMYSDGRRCGL